MKSKEAQDIGGKHNPLDKASSSGMGTAMQRRKIPGKRRVYPDKKMAQCRTIIWSFIVGIHRQQKNILP